MIERPLPPPPPPARRRVDPWLVGMALAGAAVLAFYLLTTEDAPVATTTTTTTEARPVGEAEILESARRLTLAEEGLVLRPYHPAAASGVSIGYGYDMRERTAERVRADMASVVPPIVPEWADALSEAAGLTGAAAQAFVDDHGVIFLTLEQADSLFDVTYREETVIAREFATSPADLSRFGIDYPAADWDRLHPAIRGILIDLKFRGDYRPWWPQQQRLQAAVAANDAAGVLAAITDPSAFPDDLAGSARFDARIDWMRFVLGVE